MFTERQRKMLAEKLNEIELGICINIVTDMRTLSKKLDGKDFADAMNGKEETWIDEAIAKLSEGEVRSLLNQKISCAVSTAINAYIKTSVDDIEKVLSDKCDCDGCKARRAEEGK